MLGYIANVLSKLENVPAKGPHHSLCPWTKLVYGTESQLTAPIHTAELLKAAAITRLQIATNLFYS